MLSTRRIASFFMAWSFASSGGTLTGKVTSGRLSGPPWPPRPWATNAAGSIDPPTSAAESRRVRDVNRIEMGRRRGEPRVGQYWRGAFARQDVFSTVNTPTATGGSDPTHATRDTR